MKILEILLLFSSLMSYFSFEEVPRFQINFVVFGVFKEKENHENSSRAQVNSRLLIFKEESGTFVLNRQFFSMSLPRYILFSGYESLCFLNDRAETSGL